MRLMQSACLAAFVIFGKPASLLAQENGPLRFGTAEERDEQSRLLQNHLKVEEALARLPRFKSLLEIDCDVRWPKLWTLFKAGDVQATLVLGIALLIDGLRPPGPQNDLHWGEYLLTVVVYGQLAPEVVAYEDRAPRLLTSWLLENHQIIGTGCESSSAYIKNDTDREDLKRCIEGRRVWRELVASWPIGAAEALAGCYKSETPAEVCLDQALATGIVKNFSDFAERVDARIQPGDKTTCRGGIRHHADSVPTSPLPPKAGSK